MYYPSPAVFDVTFRFGGDKCQGEVAIALPDRQQRYETSLVMCSIAGDEISFSTVTLPLPFFVDRFTGRYVQDRLLGTVERTGRELTNGMSGVWSLRRPAARDNDAH